MDEAFTLVTKPTEFNVATVVDGGAVKKWASSKRSFTSPLVGRSLAARSHGRKSEIREPAPTGGVKQNDALKTGVLSVP